MVSWITLRQIFRYFQGDKDPSTMNGYTVCSKMCKLKAQYLKRRPLKMELIEK